MSRDDHVIVGVHVTERVQHVAEVQKILTVYGCYIKTRLGLHSTSLDYCSSNGLIILELLDDKEKIENLTNELNAVEGVEAKKLIFTH